MSRPGTQKRWNDYSSQFTTAQCYFIPCIEPFISLATFPPMSHVSLSRTWSEEVPTTRKHWASTWKDSFKGTILSSVAINSKRKGESGAFCRSWLAVPTSATHCGHCLCGLSVRFSAAVRPGEWSLTYQHGCDFGGTCGTNTFLGIRSWPRAAGISRSRCTVASSTCNERDAAQTSRLTTCQLTTCLALFLVKFIQFIPVGLSVGKLVIQCFPVNNLIS